MAHYIYTKEGLAFAMGFSVIARVNYFIKKAKEEGRVPNKIIGGTEMFDLDIILGTETKNPGVNNSLYSQEELEIFASGRLFIS